MNYAPAEKTARRIFVDEMYNKKNMAGDSISDRNR